MADSRRRRRQDQSPVTKQIENRDRKSSVETEEYIGPDPKKVTSDRLIPSGVTLINCGCSDNPKGAFAMGTINTAPGKSQAGKTVLMMTMLASCAANAKFNDYDLTMDQAEQGLDFDLNCLFSPLALQDPDDLLSGRLSYPEFDDKEHQPIYSETIQDFKRNVLRKCHTGKPFIYVLDSLDSLSSTEELEREYKAALKKAVASGSSEILKEVKGSYKMEKAKHIGEALRMINGDIKHTHSALFIVQQTRQRINKTFGQTDWVTSGGEAPYFYSYHQIYLNYKGQITDEAMGIKHKIGGFTQAEIIKNKLTGKERKTGIIFPVYTDYGIDNIASCIDFLKLTKHWKSDSGGITAEEFGIKLSRDDLIRRIENRGMQDELDKIVGQVWNSIEDQMRLGRHRRF